jgi:hypothetical protein
MNWTTTAHLGNVTAGGSPLSDPFEMGVGARRGQLSIKDRKVRDPQCEHSTESKQKDVTNIVAGHGLPGRHLGCDGLLSIRRLVKDNRRSLMDESTCMNMTSFVTD